MRTASGTRPAFGTVMRQVMLGGLIAALTMGSALAAPPVKSTSPAGRPAGTRLGRPAAVAGDPAWSRLVFAGDADGALRFASARKA